MEGYGCCIGALVMSTKTVEIHKAAHWSTALTNSEVLCVCALIPSKAAEYELHKLAFAGHRSRYNAR